MAGCVIDFFFCVFRTEEQLQLMDREAEEEEDCFESIDKRKNNLF